MNQHIVVTIGQEWRLWSSSALTYGAVATSAIIKEIRKLPIGYSVYSDSGNFGSLDEEYHPVGNWRNEFNWFLYAKVEVGQVWSNKSGGIESTITEIKKEKDGRLHVFAYQDGYVDGFGYLTSDGYPDAWHGWKIFKQAPVIQLIKSVSAPIAKPTEAEWKFFAGVPDGYCACNMPKQQCSYHR